VITASILPLGAKQARLVVLMLAVETRPRFVVVHI